MIRNKHKYLYAFGIIFVVLSVIKLGGIFTVKVPWISDEAGVWLVADFFGGNGKSWISYIENSGRYSDYYGLLASLIYSPIINFFNNIIIFFLTCFVK